MRGEETTEVKVDGCWHVSDERYVRGEPTSVDTMVRHRSMEQTVLGTMLRPVAVYWTILLSDAGFAVWVKNGSRYPTTLEKNIESSG